VRRIEKNAFEKPVYIKVECTFLFLFLEEYKLIGLVGRLYLSKASDIGG
jgi:hypothetical protein